MRFSQSGPALVWAVKGVQNEFLLTWSCYISSESIFDTAFEFPTCLAQFKFLEWCQIGGHLGVIRWISQNMVMSYIIGKHFWCLFWIFNLFGQILILGGGDRVKVGVVQNEFLSCYILSESMFDVDPWGAERYSKWKQQLMIGFWDP